MTSTFTFHHWVDTKPIPHNLSYVLRKPDLDGEAMPAAPLVLYLHGAGAKGDNLDLVMNTGLLQWLQESGNAFPFWLLAPQCPAERSGWPIDAVASLLQQVIGQHPIDKQRVYLTGASMGGRGVYELAYDYRELFAAAAPLCAFGIPTLAPRLNKLPLWIFHGEQDNIVPLARGREMVDSLHAADCSAHFTILQGKGHSIECHVYSMPELWAWFAEQQYLSMN